MYHYLQNVQNFINTFSYYYEINYIYNSIYFNSFVNAMKEINQKNMSNDENLLNENILLKTWFKNMDKEYDEKLRSLDFMNLLNNYVNSSLELINNTYLNININSQLTFHDFFDLYLKYTYSPFLSYTKELKLTDHEIVFQKDNIRLLHYLNNDNNNKQNRGSENKNMLLIIYAPINRFHILDLNSSKSVVRTLLNNDIDVYLLDWGYPDKKDNELTLKDYIDYIDDAVQTIIKFRSLTSSVSLAPTNRISILGYCWGGIFSLIYTATNSPYQKQINKLILMATPIDFSKDNTTVSLWSKSTNTDKIIRTFGHFDGYFLDSVFNMRNPAKFIYGKYFNLIKHLNDKEFVNTFFDVEKWLHDTPPIPGKLYKKIVNDCYKNNLLISGKMKLEDEKLIGKKEYDYNNSNDDYNKINMNRIAIPVLSIIAENDTLVSPMSSLAIDDNISSKEKVFFKHPGGHVSLCISEKAHQELWPKVSNWIKS
jgi:polyhydroxyalkanoate synthase subunit PhaC